MRIRRSSRQILKIRKLRMLLKTCSQFRDVFSEEMTVIYSSRRNWTCNEKRPVSMNLREIDSWIERGHRQGTSRPNHIFSFWFPKTQLRLKFLSRKCLYHELHRKNHTDHNINFCCRPADADCRFLISCRVMAAPPQWRQARTTNRGGTLLGKSTWNPNLCLQVLTGIVDKIVCNNFPERTWIVIQFLFATLEITGVAKNDYVIDSTVFRIWRVPGDLRKLDPSRCSQLSSELLRADARRQIRPIRVAARRSV